MNRAIYGTHQPSLVSFSVRVVLRYVYGVYPEDCASAYPDAKPDTGGSTTLGGDSQGSQPSSNLLRRIDSLTDVSPQTYEMGTKAVRLFERPPEEFDFDSRVPVMRHSILKA
jgi:hypothetical protein